MHARFASRRAWLDFERQQGEPEEVTVTPTQPASMKRARALYTVQFGAQVGVLTCPEFERSSDPIECKDARSAARLAANLAFVFNAPGATHSDDYWLLRDVIDEVEWKSSTQFVRLTRTYPE